MEEAKITSHTSKKKDSKDKKDDKKDSHGSYSTGVISLDEFNFPHAIYVYDS